MIGDGEMRIPAIISSEKKGRWFKETVPGCKADHFCLVFGRAEGKKMAEETSIFYFQLYAFDETELKVVVNKRPLSKLELINLYFKTHRKLNTSFLYKKKKKFHIIPFLLKLYLLW